MNERREDWSQGVDENLASLNAGQRVWERDLEVVRRQLKEIDRLLRGDPEKETSGTIGRIETLESKVAKSDAVLFMDPTGKRGLVHDFYESQGGREDRRIGWANLTKVVVALIMSGLLGHFWENIHHFVTGKSTDPVDQMIENVKHPKGKHRHVPAPEVVAD